MKKIVSFLIFAGLGVVVILAAGALFVQTAYFKGWLRAFITGTVNNEIGGRLAVDRVGGSIVTGITLSGITITAENKTVLAVDEVRIAYFLPALLAKTFEIPRVRISRPRVTFRQGADGTWDFQRAFAGRRKRAGKPPASSPLAGWTFRVGKVDLDGGSAAMTERRGKDVLRVPAFSLSSRAVLRVVRKDLEGTVDLGVLRVETEAPVTLPVMLNGEGSFGKGVIRIRNLDLAFGRSRGRVRAILKGAAPFIDAHAEFPVVSFDDVRRIVPSVSLSSAAAITADFRGKPASFAAGCRISYGDLYVESSGTVDIPRLRIAGISRIRHLHPEEVLPAATNARQEFPRGDVNIDVAFNGDGNPFEAGSATGTVTVLPSAIRGISTPGATLAVTAVRGNADLRAEDFVTSAGTFTIRGAANAAGLAGPGGPVTGTVLVNGTHVDLSAIIGTDTVKSDLNFSLSAAVQRGPGAGNGTALSGSFRASSSTVRGIAFSEIASTFSLAGGTVNVRSLSVLSDYMHVTASGTVVPGGRINLSYALGVSDIGVFSRLAPSLQAAGSIISRGTIVGTTARPSFAGVVSGEELHYQGFVVKDLTIEANVTGGGKRRLPSGEVRISAADVRAGKTPVKGLSVQTASDGERTSFILDLRKDDTRSLRLVGDGDLREQGLVRFALTTFEILTGTAVWSNTRPVQVLLSPKGVAIDSFNIASASQTLSVSGHWEKRGDIRLDAVAREIDLRTVSGAAGSPVPLTGVLQSSFTVRGKTAFPEVNGTLFVSSGALGGVAFEHMASTVTYGGGETRLSFSVVREDREVLTASGTVRENGGALGAYLTARDLDLAVASVLTPAVEQASGRLSAAVAVTGSIREPRINGEVLVPGGTLRIRGTEVTYRDLEVRLRIAGDTLYLDRLSLRSEQGDASVKGSVSLAGLKPASASIDIAAHRFKAMNANLFSGLLDADLHLRPQGDGTLLDGTITVVEGLVNIPKVTARPSVEITVIETGAGGKQRVVKAPGQTAVPLVEGLVLHVDAEMPGNLRVQGEGANAELEGKLLIARNAGEPVTLSGNVSTVRGTYQFRGKLLTIDTARVSFTGEPTINPELNARASTIVENITIYVNVRGTLQQPRITITSDPPHDESDLVAYLVFGRPLSKLDQSENQLVQRTAVQALGGLAVTGVRDLLGQRLAPEIINVYSGQESGFAVGKYITNRLFIRYEWRFGLEEVRQTIINVQLNKHFALNSQVGSELTSGLDLLWTTTY